MGWLVCVREECSLVQREAQLFVVFTELIDNKIALWSVADCKFVGRSDDRELKKYELQPTIWREISISWSVKCLIFYSRSTAISHKSGRHFRKSRKIPFAKRLLI